MSTQRESAWQHYDRTSQQSIAYQFARYGLGLTFESLPDAVVHQAKRSLLDGLGNAIGGYSAPGRPVCEAAAEDLGGASEATLIGSGQRVSALTAALVNSFLIRYLDYHDLGGNHHGCDAIASILALCERQGAGGRDFLTALVASYELGARIKTLEAGRARTGSYGFIFDSNYNMVMPPALGRLLGLTETQVANAIGICASHSFALSAIMAEEPSMSKNIRTGFIAHDALLCCILAKHGFTGPVRVIEGKSGIIETLYPDFADVEDLLDFKEWKILGTRHKYFCGCAILQPIISAVVAIVKENDLRPAEIEAVKLTCLPRFATIFGKFPFKYPRNAETASHSAWYTAAIAIKERRFGPDAYASEKFTDPVVADLTERITIAPGSDLGHSQGMAEILTKDGRRYHKRVDTPHGFDDDPLTDAELEEKFSEMAVKHMDKIHIQRVIDTIWSLEDLNDMGSLTALMVFESR